MTLILSQITPDYVIQVSDRRLTRPDGSLFDDDSNKAVLYNDHFAFAYTGLAHTSTGERRDEWLSKVLLEHSQKPFGDAVKGICSAATTEMASNSLAKNHKRSTIVGVGWITNKHGASQLLPLYLSISNFQNRRGEWVSEVSDEFTAYAFSLPKGSLHWILAAGQPLDAQIRVQIDRIGQECIRRQVGPSELARLLATGVLTVASFNPAVGSNIMIAAIPRAAVEKLRTPGLRVTLLGAPMEDTATFLHIPANGSEPVRYGPKMVSHGALFSSFEVRPLPPDYKPEPPTPKHVFALTRLVEKGSVLSPPLERSAELMNAGFKRIGVTMETSTDDWEKGAACPYYGAIVSIRGPSDEIDKVELDKRFFLLSKNEADLQVGPDPGWLGGLGEWFASQGAPPDFLQRLMEGIQEMTKAQVIEYIKSCGVLLRSD